MKNKRKALLLTLCAVLLVAASALGTFAYLTDRDTVTNTFTVGSVGLKLDEADVKPDGTIDTNARVKENSYHLLPGHNYIKDPTVTVEAGSEASYVRMLVTINYSDELDAIFAPNGANLTSIFNGYDENTWARYGVTKDATSNTRTYEFRYKEIVPATTSDKVLEPLFQSFTIPGAITKEQLATLVTKDAAGNITGQFTITVVAHAIQADGFATADLAWGGFEEQYP